MVQALGATSNVMALLLVNMIGYAAGIQKTGRVADGIFIDGEGVVVAACGFAFFFSGVQASEVITGLGGADAASLRLLAASSCRGRGPSAVMIFKDNTYSRGGYVCVPGLSSHREGKQHTRLYYTCADMKREISSPLYISQKPRHPPFATMLNMSRTNSNLGFRRKAAMQFLQG